MQKEAIIISVYRLDLYTHTHTYTYKIPINVAYWFSYFTIDPTANTVFRQKRAILPENAHAQNEYFCDTFEQTHSGFHRHYADIRKIPEFTKKDEVSWMCFIILNDLYMAHHNSLGICHQLKIRHLYGTFNFSTQCICMGTGSLFVYCFRGKARPLRRKIIFAVASFTDFLSSQLLQSMGGGRLEAKA